MSWPLSLVVAAISGLVGLVLSGLVANLAVEWHKISSFEGGAGYFVVLMALFGLVAGGVIGLVTARTMAPASPTFLKVLGTAAGIVIVLAGGVGGASRALADIEPTIDGEGLYLAFELRWPERSHRPPGDYPGEGYARLGAGASSNVVRDWGAGVLFVDDAKQVDGRWIVPGVADIWTTRGKRLLDVGIGDSSMAAFIVPLPSHPGPNEQQWSDWYPHARDGAPPLPDQFAYRFRVVKAGDTIREESVGPFGVATAIRSLYSVSGTLRRAASSTFRVTYRGRSIEGVDTVDAAAELAGETPALLLRVGDSQNGGHCLLVYDAGDSVVRTAAGDCAGELRGDLLTADERAWKTARERVIPPGWLDRTTFANVGLYRINGGILDTRTRAFTPERTTAETGGGPHDVYAISDLPPISLSPDESSYVWYAQKGSAEDPVLAVTHWSTGRTQILPIDRTRMRYNDYKEIGPSWVAHHFEWRRGGDGVMQLTERPGFTPLPYRGELEIGADRRFAMYTLRPAGSELRQALVDAMVRDLGGERLPDELDGYYQVVRLDGRVLKSAVVSTGGFISVTLDDASSDPAYMKELAARLDRVVASGAYDALFHLDPPTKAP